VAVELPTAALVEVGDEDEQPVRGGVDVRREGGDLVAENLERVRVLEGVGGPGAGVGPVRLGLRLGRRTVRRRRLTDEEEASRARVVVRAGEGPRLEGVSDHGRAS
jgi:hypothetical protein